MRHACAVLTRIRLLSLLLTTHKHSHHTHPPDPSMYAVLSGFLLQKLGVFNPNQKNKVEEGLTWSDDDATIFVPPAERQEFIDAKAEAIKKKPVAEEVMQALKKKLMRRTFKQIPLVHELQQQGPSADKLYKKGMITDALHNRYKDMKAYFDVEFPEVQQVRTADIQVHVYVCVCVASCRYI
jgi:hypothetical protein